MHLGKIASENYALGEEEAGGILEATHCVVAVGHVIAKALAVGKPISIESGDGQHIRQINLAHESLPVLHQLVQQRDALRIDGCLRLIAIDRCRHAADQIGLRMRVLSAENSLNANEFPLQVKRFDVVRHREQVHFGGQPIRGIAPVSRSGSGSAGHSTRAPSPGLAPP